MTNSPGRFSRSSTDQILPICPTPVRSVRALVERVPYDGVGEHLLASEGVEVATAAAVDGEADDGVGGEDATEGGE